MFSTTSHQRYGLYATTTAEFQTEKEKGTKNDMQQTQEDDHSLSIVLSWVRNGKQPHRSVLQGHSRNIWVPWNNLDSPQSRK